jgi:ribosomal protein S18 acetylase RimI-like enzyme
MTHYYRMQLDNTSSVAATSSAATVVPYNSEEHHIIIPKLYAAAFGLEPWPETWDQISGFDPKGVFIAQEPTSREPIGFVIGFRRWDIGYISVVAVVPKRRRQGIATVLIAAVVQYLREQGIAIIQIDVEQNNTAAVQAYEKFGFHIISGFSN